VKRPTLAGIASRAGVTKAAVSFALNGQPGVSAAKRGSTGRAARLPGVTSQRVPV
jgi:DNA-binding LacI/PurR family transcriptional regulator